MNMLEILSDAIVAMAEDGWLYYGPEGMSEAQQKCYDAYQLILASDPKWTDAQIDQIEKDAEMLRSKMVPLRVAED